MPVYGWKPGHTRFVGIQFDTIEEALDAVAKGSGFGAELTYRHYTVIFLLSAQALQVCGWLVRMSSRDPRPNLRWLAARFYSSAGRRRCAVGGQPSR